MNILIMGLPGSGKGTQAEFLVDTYGLGHISTGDIFRSVTKSEGPLADEIRSYIDNGNLVPDELTARLLTNEMNEDRYSNGFLLDGFPRNINQAEILDDLLAKEDKKVDTVLFLDLDEEVIKERLVNRLVCPVCGASYHKTTIKPKVEWVCDNDGTDLVQREDDQLEKIEHRLNVAKEQTLPVIDYYKKSNLVKHIKIDENDSAEKIFESIEEALK